MKHICKNCSHQFAAADKFCPNCGQSAHTERLQFSHILHDFFHAFFHADKGFFLLVKKLALNPGSIALHYVNGQRKRYFNPFSFLLIIAAIFLFVNLHFNALDPLNNDPKGQFLEKYSNLILISSLPVLAAISWMIFKRSGKNYSECLVLCCYLLGEMYLFFSLVCSPLILQFREKYQLIIIVYAGVWLLYFVYGAVVFFQEKSWKGILKAVAVIVLFQFMTGMLGQGMYYLIKAFSHS